MQKVKKTEGTDNTLSLRDLKTESNIRRNKLVLEDVVRQRDKDTWFSQTCAMINDQQR